MPRKAPQIILSPRMRGILEAKVRAHKTPQRLAERIRIVLGASEGRLNLEEASSAAISHPSTICVNRRTLQAYPRAGIHERKEVHQELHR